MKAAYYTEKGQARDVLQIGELPTPQPGMGEVRVRLHASGVNPSDIKNRSGTADRSAGTALTVPHSDGAGIIDAVGAGADPARVGERVWVYNGQWQRAMGTAAQYIALPSELALPLPESTSFHQGACLGIPAMTALAAVEHADCRDGQTVLVQGGAGAVGHYAIQFARLRGARVIATVSSAEKGRHARQAGADHIVDYVAQDVVQAVRTATGGRGADAIIEVNFSANCAADLRMLAPYGRIVVYGAATDTAALPLRHLRGLNAALQFMRVYDIPAALRTRVLAALQTYLERGVLLHALAQVYPLDRIAEAHDKVDTGSPIGNVVLDC